MVASFSGVSGFARRMALGINMLIEVRMELQLKRCASSILQEK
jgi:hypothetical protein